MGIANLPLHYGKVPLWLFSRVVKLARAISSAILTEATGQTLNLVASESAPARITITDIATNEKPESIMADLKNKDFELACPPLP